MHLLNNFVRSGAIMIAESLTNFIGVWSSPTALHALSEWMWNKMSSIVTGQRKKEIFIRFKHF